MPASTTLPIRNAPTQIQNRIRIESPCARELAPGTLLGGAYRVLRCLSHGGMGDIYVARCEPSPDEVVVKVLGSGVTINCGEAIVRFRQEATVLDALRHPNVVRVFDFNLTPEGRPYLVMEYLRGQNLGDLLMTREFSAKEVSTIVRHVASALDAAHRLGIVHRDLKPENIMVVPRPGQSDLIKVIDFGICKARRLNHMTMKGMIMGTPEFMSPEQAQGRQEKVEAPSDQFALAVVTYLLLAGRMPWTAKTPAEFLHCAMYRYPLALTDDGTCRSVETVLFRAMAKSPQDRYPSILAYSQALDRALVEAGLVPPPLGYARGAQAPRVRDSERPGERSLGLQPRSGRRVRWPAIALMVLVFGACLASVGVPAIREGAYRQWNGLRSFAAGPAADQSHRMISKVLQRAMASYCSGRVPELGGSTQRPRRIERLELRIAEACTVINAILAKQGCPAAGTSCEVAKSDAHQ